VTEQPQTISERTADLVDQYTAELNAWIEERVPTVLINREYAARSAALMIALNRQLARIAVAFGEVHEIDPAEVGDLVFRQFAKNHGLALDAVRTTEMVIQ